MALEMFGARAGPDMAAAIREGRLNLDELIKTLKNSPETIEKAAEDTEIAADKFVVLKNQIVVSLEPLGKKLLDAIEGVIPAIQRLIKNITGIIEKFNSLSPAQQEMILKFALLAAAIGPVLTVVGKLITVGGTLFSTIGSISTALGAAGGGSGALGAAFTALTGPVGIATAAITAVITVGVLLYKNWDVIRGKAGVLKNAVSETWEKLKTTTASKWEGIKTYISNSINSAKAAVKDGLAQIFNFFKNLRLPEIKIPKIKLPHFKLKGQFSLIPPSVPKLSVNWYANGGIFTRPSIIGVGESGTEAVLPIDRLDDILAKAFEKVKGGTTNSGITLHIENFINNTDKDIEQLAYELEFYRQRIAVGRGGV